MSNASWETTSKTGNWSGCACSADGTEMVACAYGARLWVSTDSGSSWSEARPAGDTNKNWFGVAMSDDGQVVHAFVDSSSSKYHSHDAGANWSSVTSGNTPYESYGGGCDADGSVALIGNGYGSCNLSTDTGATFSSASPAGGDQIYYATGVSRATGVVLLAAIANGRVYRSINTGSSWSEIQPDGAANKNWQSCAINDDGSVMYFGINSGRIWRTIDSGATFSEVRPKGDTTGAWQGISCSGNGAVVLAQEYGSRLWLSLDFGATWTEERPAGDVDKNWRACSVSRDGTKILAGVRNTSSGLYVGTTNLTTVTLQQGVSSYTGASDNWMNEGAPTVNHDSDQTFALGLDGTTRVRDLLKFDLSTFAGKTLTSALLGVYMANNYYSKASVIQCHRVKRDWIADQSTWNNYASGSAWTTAGCADTTNDREATVLGQFSIASGDGAGWHWAVLDLAMVQAWIDGGTSNYGLLLKDDSEANTYYWDFDGCNYTTSSLRPIFAGQYVGGGGAAATSFLTARRGMW